MNANLVEIVFWISVLFIFYTYVGYPVFLFILTRLKKCPIIKTPIKPAVSVVLAVRNEAARITERLRNFCEQHYPADKIEIIVVSDGSDDDTDNLVVSYPAKHVNLIRLPEPSGKAIAVNAGVAAAQHEVIVFADARQQFDPMVISELVANFADSSIGCVGGELVFLSNRNSTVRAEMGAYWKYEKAVRRMESDTGSVIGVSGCIYAIRRILYKPLLPGTILDDVLTPLNIANQGYRVIFESAAIAYDIMSGDIEQEWRRKVRTLAGNWQLLSLAPWLFIPRRGKIWGRFLSHKICRILVPFFLIMLLLLNLKLDGPFYRTFLFSQIVCYSLAAWGYLFPGSRAYKVFGIPYFFVVLNLAALVGFSYWITGNDNRIWSVASAKQR